MLLLFRCRSFTPVATMLITQLLYKGSTTQPTYIVRLTLCCLLTARRSIFDIKTRTAVQLRTLDPVRRMRLNPQLHYHRTHYTPTCHYFTNKTNKSKRKTQTKQNKKSITPSQKPSQVPYSQPQPPVPPPLTPAQTRPHSKRYPPSSNTAGCQTTPQHRPRSPPSEQKEPPS